MIAEIPEVLAALQAGRPVIVADAADRENEGDVIIAAQFATKEWLAWMVRHSSGYLCAPMPNARADALGLPLMVERNEDARRTAYTVSVDAAGMSTTGISAADRARTARVLADPDSRPADLVRPGHVLPLRAVEGGVRERPGHTEATVELLRLAGLEPVGVIGELVHDNGDMMLMPALLALGAEHGLPVTTVQHLVAWMGGHHGRAGGEPGHVRGEPDRAGGEPDHAGGVPPEADASSVQFLVETTLPTKYGNFTVRAYHDRLGDTDHLALLADPLVEVPLVRVHSECLTGEAFRSLKCECGAQLADALARTATSGGAVIYLRGHEGRGVGLVNKLRAYRLQELGRDTVEANVELGLPVDARDYSAAAAILRELGLTRIRLLTNNPDKAAALRARGVDVTEVVPQLVGVTGRNGEYLRIKGAKLGHLIDAAELHRALDQSDDPVGVATGGFSATSMEERRQSER